jgi:hypothetical protein
MPAFCPPSRLLLLLPLLLPLPPRESRTFHRDPLHHDRVNRHWGPTFTPMGRVNAWGSLSLCTCPTQSANPTAQLRSIASRTRWHGA